MPEDRVVLLAKDCSSTRCVYHALRARLASDVRLEVILEAPVGTLPFVKRRVKRMGLRVVAGQMLFMALVVPVLRVMGRRRVKAIKAAYGLNDAPIPAPIHHVSSANAVETRRLLEVLSPSVVVVNGTRVLDADTLHATSAPFINMHAGITPTFRGVHGGYWALVLGRPDLVGTTIHRVDEGIDTGSVIEQACFSVTAEDSFWTYPYLHTACGITPLVRAVEDALKGTLQSRNPEASLPSVLRFHPTFCGYLTARARRGIR